MAFIPDTLPDLQGKRVFGAEYRVRAGSPHHFIMTQKLPTHLEPAQGKTNHALPPDPAATPGDPPPAERPGFEETFYDQFVPELIASYGAVGGLNNRDAHNMPSTRAVGQICEDLLQLLFPGFHDDDAVYHGTLAELTHERLGHVGRRLEDQVRKSVRIGNPKKPTGRTPPILRLFFHSLAHVRDLMRSDIEAAYEGDPAALFSEEIILSYPFIEAIAIQRLAHVLYVAGAPIVPRMMTEWAHSRTGIDIHPGARIGSHFFIDHGTGVVIGETCIIGDNVRVYQGVTLGAKSFPILVLFLMMSNQAHSRRGSVTLTKQIHAFNKTIS